MTGEKRGGDHPRPACFGILDRVFPMGGDGLRESPPDCLVCCEKTACLRTALQGRDGWKAEEERVDRAYVSGHLGFMGRWSRRKALSLKKKKAMSPDGEE